MCLRQKGGSSFSQCRVTCAHKPPVCVAKAKLKKRNKPRGKAKQYAAEHQQHAGMQHAADATAQAERCTLVTVHPWHTKTTYGRIVNAAKQTQKQ